MENGKILIDKDKMMMDEDMRDYGEMMGKDSKEMMQIIEKIRKHGEKKISQKRHADSVVFYLS